MKCYVNGLKGNYQQHATIFKVKYTIIYMYFIHTSATEQIQ